MTVASEVSLTELRRHIVARHHLFDRVKEMHLLASIVAMDDLMLNHSMTIIW